MDLRQQLRYRTLAAFRLTVETRSATRAAEVLGITQPAVSQLLAGLERAVGFQLFSRGAGRRLEPTGEARLLLEHVSRVLDAMGGLERLAKSLAGAEGRLEDRPIGTPRAWYQQPAE